MGLTPPVDTSILHEIVRIVDARRKVPERVIVRGREYQITYLEDHQRRLEEALQRFDHDRLNMLYGQLASKVKYQMLRRVPAQPVPAKATAKGARPAARPAKAKTSAPARTKRAAKTRPAAKAAPRAKSKTAKTGKTAKTAKTARPQGQKTAARRGRAARKGTAKKK